MRLKFDEQLKQLGEEMTHMGSMIEQAIQDAVQALLNHDVKTAQRIMKEDDLVDQEQKYSAALDKALEEYAEVEAQAAGLDPVELYEAQLAIRDSHEAAAQGKIELTFGKQYSPIRWMEAQGQARRLLRENSGEQEMQLLLRQCQYTRHRRTGIDYSK